MNLVAMIDYWARLKPETPAILMLDSMITYASLSRAIRSAAGYLSRHKLDPCAPVGILVDHPARNVVLNCALMSLGVPSIVVREAQVAHLAKIGAKSLLHDGRGQAMPDLSLLPVDPGWFADANPPKTVALGPGDRTKLTFTSGTTGTPKPISFTDEDIEARCRYVRILSGDAPWLRILIMPGLSTIFGFSQVAVGLEAGRTICFAGSAEDAARIIELFAIDLLACSTQQAQVLVDYLQSRRQRLRSLRWAWIGGAPLTEALGQKISDFLCRDIFCIYASTETHLAAFGRWDQIKHVPGAVGYICPWAQVECVDEQREPVAPNQEGELRIRAPHQALPYPAPADAGDQIDTWFYPGDRGAITSEGLLVIKGRTADTLNKGGVKMSAGLVEQCIEALPGVVDVAVCGIPNRLGAEEIAALIVSKAPLALDALNAALARANIEASIDRIVAVEKIPRNELGKVNREEIRMLARRQFGF